jgi:hypothetical protein
MAVYDLRLLKHNGRSFRMADQNKAAGRRALTRWW